jgi:hypothetical protein
MSEKEKLIKKHLGINTPDWIVQNCIKMLNEFEDVTTRTFAENQEVTYKGKKYFFKEYNPKNGKTLIANAKSVRYNDYNDWWVDSTHVHNPQ